MWNTSLEMWLLGGLAVYTFLATSNLVDLSGLFDDDDSGSSEAGEVTSEETIEETRSAVEELAENPSLAIPTGEFVGEETITGTSGMDEVSGETDTFLPFDTGALIETFEGDDNISASNSNDWIYAGDGDDTVSARLAADAVFGGAGNDRLDGGWQNDVVFGESGDDNLTGLFDADTLFGGIGDDTLSGASEGAAESEDRAVVDTLFGGSGDDLIHLNQFDHAHGGEGADVFRLVGEGLAEDNAAVIHDFDARVDRIEVNATNFEEPPAVQAVPIEGTDNVGIYVDGELQAIVLDQPRGGSLPSITVDAG